MGRRARTPFTLYYRDDCGCFWVQFRVKGRRLRKSTEEGDRGAAESRAAAIWQEAKARAGEPVPAGAVSRSLKGLAADLIMEAARHGRAETYARDLEIDLRLHILPRWSAAEAVTSLSWENAREEMHADGQSWASVRRIGKHLRALLRFAKRKGAIASVPEILSPPRALIVAEAAEREPLTRRERDALLADMRRRGNVRALRCYEVMFFNLFRRSTVARLMPAWIDFQKHTIRVPPNRAKNSQERIYWMHPRTEKAVRAQLRENGDATKPVFGPFDHSNVFWSACERLGIATREERRGLTAHHVARRTAATLLVDARVSTKDRMAAGGWESIEAAERYDKGEQVERSRRALRKLK